jgi:hypothetical protein
MREGDPKGWPTVLITVLGNWEKTVLCGHLIMPYITVQASLGSYDEDDYS